jgi:hypothetical protein
MANIKGIVRNESLQPVNGFLVRAHRLDTGAVLGEATSATVTTGDPLESMVALRMNFDESSTDTSQYSHVVYLEDGATVAAGAGKFGGGLDCATSGANARAEVSRSANLKIGGPFCLEFFINTASLDMEATVVSGMQALGNDPARSVQVIAGSAGQITARVFDSVMTPAQALAPGTWNHIAVTLDATNNARLFLDGAAVSTGAVTAPFSMVGDPVWMFGGRPSPYNRGVNGCYMDGVRVTVGDPRYPAGGFVPPEAPFLAPVTEVGAYEIVNAYTGECYVVCFDDAAAPVRNHQILRTTA